MTLNAEQIASSARDLTELWSTWPGGQYAKAHAGDGPYHLLTINCADHAPYAAVLALDGFPGVPIPNLCQLSRTVTVGEKTLHVVPELVKQIICWHEEDDFAVDIDLAIAPFDAPPTEANMTDALVAAMTMYDRRPPGGWSRHNKAFHVAGSDLGPAVRRACDQLGWRNVASLVSAMTAETRQSPDDVVAILTALTAAPLLAG